MRSAPKFPVVILAGLLALLSASCSKKENPAPLNNTTVAPTTVYDIKNTSSIYPTTGMAVDASGNLYFADVISNVIKMYTPAGVATIIAGSGHGGSTDGKGTAASFYFPSALAIDAAKNIYVADAANNMIRKIDPQGNVSTVAGSGATGHADGAGNIATFNFPQGISVDNNGNVYVADTGNDLIRKIGLDGTVTTLAGRVAAGNTNGAGSQALFNIPQGLAADSQGNIYVADAGNNLVRKITSSGVVTTLAGSGLAVSSDGTGVSAGFNFPDALAIDGTGTLYVTEALGNNVHEISTDNKVTEVAFKKLAFGGEINFRGALVFYLPIFPNGVATNSNADVIYINDYGNSWLEIF